MSTHTSSPGTHAGGPAPSAATDQPRRSWGVLGLMLAAQFMVVLDISVVNVALPSIGESLSLSASDYQWAVSAYVLFSGGLLLFGGRLSRPVRPPDHVPHRPTCSPSPRWRADWPAPPQP